MPDTGMIITLGLGEAGDAHPKNKQDVGRRLALWALADVYDRKNVAGWSPMFASQEIRGREIVLSFDHAENGLVSQGENSEDSPLRATTGLGIGPMDGSKVTKSSSPPRGDSAGLPCVTPGRLIRPSACLPRMDCPLRHFERMNFLSTSVAARRLKRFRKQNELLKTNPSVFFNEYRPHRCRRNRERHLQCLDVMERAGKLASRRWWIPRPSPVQHTCRNSAGAARDGTLTIGRCWRPEKDHRRYYCLPPFPRIST